MQLVNYTEFRNNLAAILNMVNDNSEIVLVSRSKGKNVVVMSIKSDSTRQLKKCAQANRPNIS
jgi:antitoxin YefM